MNQGIAGNRRTRRGERGAGHPMGGMSLKKMARQMGMDPEELGPEAENIWKMLDTLATEDPTEYQNYIKKTLEEKAEFDARPEEPHFFPEEGYVIKGLTSKGVKTFVNVCGHNAVQHPTAHNGKPMTNDPRQPTDGCEIPMAVGERRETEDHAGTVSMAVDVVVNPWVLTRAADDNFFKVSVSDLAVNAVGSEQGLTIRKPYKYIQSKYKGGTGEHNNKPVAFIIPGPDGKTKKKDGSASSATTTTAVVPKRPDSKVPAAQAPQEAKLPIQELEDPKDLMSMLGDLSDSDVLGRPKKGGLVEELNVPNTSSTKPSGKKNKKSLISEMVNGKAVEPEKLDDPEKVEAVARDDIVIEEVLTPGTVAVEAPKKKTGKKKPTVKKGFLFAEKAKKAKPLYQGGSNEGKAEHPWNRLMGRSKVVDMNDMTPEQQKAYAKDGTVPKEEDIGKKDKKKERTDFGDAEFEELMQLADPDYALESNKQRRAGDEMNEEMRRWTELMNPELVPGGKDSQLPPSAEELTASSKTAEKLKEDLKKQAAQRKKEKKERKKREKRPGTTDYSMFEEIDEDADLVDNAEKLQRLKQKREQLETKIAAEREEEAVRVREAAFREKQRLEKERKKQERADRRPGGVDSYYSKFEDIDEDTELLDEEQVARKKQEQQAARKKEEEARRREEEDQAAAKLVAEEETRFKAQQSTSKDSGAEEAPREKKNKVISLDLGDDSGVADKAGGEEEILEIGADGSFDFDAPGKAPTTSTEPAFSLKGKFQQKQKPKLAAKKADPVASNGLPIPAYRTKRAKGDVAGTYKYNVVVELPGLTSMAGVELDVSSKLVRLKAKGYGELKVKLNEIVDENRVAAKFSKTKRTLSVKVPIL